ncbi:hypothetical protein NBRC116586_00860 [Pseudooceanicola nitratireducens]
MQKEDARPLPQPKQPDKGQQKRPPDRQRQQHQRHVQQPLSVRTPPEAGKSRPSVSGPGEADPKQAGPRQAGQNNGKGDHVISHARDPRAALLKDR